MGSLSFFLPSCQGLPLVKHKQEGRGEKKLGDVFCKDQIPRYREEQRSMRKDSGMVAEGGVAHGKCLTCLIDEDFTLWLQTSFR